MTPASGVHPGRLIAGLVGALALCATGYRAMAHNTQDAAMHPAPAVDLIVRGFDAHRIVALSDGSGHGQADTLELFVTLVRDSRFARTVRNIVVEFGNARYQAVIDRYTAGDVVARDELRHVWEDTTQISGVWSLPMYEQMFAEVRSVNAGLAPALRIRILLGDPPIDWSRVNGPADEDMNDWRDAHFAHVVERQVVDRGQKALLLIGGAHLSRKVVLPNSLIHLLDSRFPGQVWVVSSLDASRIDRSLTSRFGGWTLPAGASVRGTWFGKLDLQQIGFHLSRGTAEDDMDAVLLLSADAPRLQESPALDVAYRRELARRRAIADATMPFRGGKIRFVENSPALSTESEEWLKAVLTELLRDRGLTLLVKTFADETEPDAAALTARRAELLVAWLVERGVARNRLIPRGCGALRPLTFGLTALDRDMNRRAELVRLTRTAGCEPPW
jgi:outer membrane protein OmpA-like peptidoglycan-associated protein